MEIDVTQWQCKQTSTSVKQTWILNINVWENDKMEKEMKCLEDEFIFLCFARRSLMAVPYLNKRPNYKQIEKASVFNASLTRRPALHFIEICEVCMSTPVQDSATYS